MKLSRDTIVGGNGPFNKIGSYSNYNDDIVSVYNYLMIVVEADEYSRSVVLRRQQLNRRKYVDIDRNTS